MPPAEFREICAGHHVADKGSSAVGIDAFFEINRGAEAPFNALRDKAAKQTAEEDGCLDYNFCANVANPNQVMVRELYKDVAATMTHMQRVDPIMGEMMTSHSKLVDFIVTGSAAEIQELKGPIGGKLGDVAQFRVIDAGFHQP